MSPPKVDPEALALRARPRPVTRINRRVLILLAGTGMVLVLGATLIALDPLRFTGTIATLMMNVRAKIVANEAKASDGVPDFRVYAGPVELGAAWHTRSNGEEPRDYLGVSLDYPSFPEPIRAALFTDDDGAAVLVWNRRDAR